MFSVQTAGAPVRPTRNTSIVASGGGENGIVGGSWTEMRKAERIKSELEVLQPHLAARAQQEEASRNRKRSVDANAIPSYAQPKNMSRKQPPLMERVKQFVAEHGSRGDLNQSGPSYYAQQTATQLLSKGQPAGGATKRQTRQQQVNRDVLAAIAVGPKSLSEGRPITSGSGSANIRLAQKTMRERMHRATQGFPIVPLPTKILASFGAAGDSMTGDFGNISADHDAMTWLGLIRVKKCGLCLQEFTQDSMATRVSLQAIRRIREEWGARHVKQTALTAPSPHSSPSSTRAATPQIEGPSPQPSISPHPYAGTGSASPTTVYSAVEVCRFCAQFFGVYLGCSFVDDPSLVVPPMVGKAHCRPKPFVRLSNNNGGEQPEAHDGDKLRLKEFTDTAGEMHTSAEQTHRSDEISEVLTGSAMPTARPVESDHDSSPSRSASTASHTSSTRSSSSSSSSSSPVKSPSKPRTMSNVSPKREVSPPSSLAPPTRPVVPTRASLLRRTHHSQRVQADEEAAAHRDVSPSMAFHGTGKYLQPPSSHLKEQHGHSQYFDDKATARVVAGSKALRASRHKASAPVRRPVADVFVLGDEPQGPPVQDHDEAHRSVAKDHPEPAESNVEGKSESLPVGPPTRLAPWSGEVRVLVLACQAYDDRVPLPLAVPQIARRFAHWCEHLLSQPEVNARDSNQCASLLTESFVTTGRIISFLESCAAAQASPLIAFIGHVTPSEEKFNDFILHFPASKDECAPPGEGIPDKYLHLAAHDEAENDPVVESHTLPVTSGSRSKRIARPASAPSWRRAEVPSHRQSIPQHEYLSAHQLRRQSAVMHKPEEEIGCELFVKRNSSRSPPHLGTSKAASTGRRVNFAENASQQLSVAFLDKLCDHLSLPNPILIVDSCFGPLVCRPTALTVIHPSRPRDGKILSSDVGMQSNLVEKDAIPCGGVLSGVVKFVNEVVDGAHAAAIERHSGILSPLRSETSAAKRFEGTSGTWSDCFDKILDEGNLGAAVQQLFHHHLRDDRSQQQFVVTAPLAPRTALMPRGRRQRSLNVSEANIMWCPVGSQCIEVFFERDGWPMLNATAEHSKATAETLSADDQDMLNNATRSISQAFALILDARHTVLRMSTPAQRNSFATSIYRSIHEGMNILRARQGDGALDGVTYESVVGQLMFNMSTGLSGHVIAMLSTTDHTLLLQAVSALREGLSVLQQCGWVVLAAGFVSSHSSEETVQIDDGILSRGGETTFRIIDVQCPQ